MHPEPKIAWRTIAHLENGRAALAPTVRPGRAPQAEGTPTRASVQTQEGRLMKVEDHNNLTDAAIGVILTEIKLLARTRCRW
mgnify:CR=1 FL=1